MSTFLLIVSVTLQLTGAVLALRFIRHSERRLPWFVLSFALLLMAGRRLVSLYALHVEGVPTSRTAELIALCVSVCVVVGISGMGPLIEDVRRRSRAEVDERRRAESLLRNHLNVVESAVADLVEQKTLAGQVRRILGAVGELLKADRAQLWLLRNDKLELAVQWPTAPPEDAADNAEHPEGASRDALATRAPVLWHGDDGSELGLAGVTSAGSTLLVPLVQGRETLGLYAISSPARREFAAEELRLAGSLASQVAAAVLMNRLAEHARDVAVIDERNRLAGEIHDTLAQGFAGIQRLLEAALAAAAADPKKSDALVARALTVATGSLAEARRSMWQLRPPTLSGDPLATQISTMVRRLCRDTSVEVQLETTSDPVSVPARVQSELLKIAQEAALNAVRHGDPHRISIGVVSSEGGLELRVRDDGRGMNDTSHEASPGFGLLGMRERASRIGGQLRIESAPGRGTTVIVEAPIGTQLTQ